MVTQDNFDEWLAGGARSKAVLFWRDNCDACKDMFPVISAVARQYPTIDFLALNATKNPRIFERIVTPGLPTLVLYENDALKTSLIGYTEADGVTQWLETRANVKTEKLCEFCASVREKMRQFLPKRLMTWIESYAR